MIFSIKDRIRLWYRECLVRKIIRRIENDPYIRRVRVGSVEGDWAAVRYDTNRWVVCMDFDKQHYLSIRQSVYYVTPDQGFFEQTAAAKLNKIHTVCGIIFESLPERYQNDVETLRKLYER